MHTRAILVILGWTIGVHGELFDIYSRVDKEHTAQIGKYPYQARIIKDDQFICGGSIVSEHLILTAAHCIYGGDATKYAVIVGTYNSFSLISADFRDLYVAKKLIWHPKYDDNSVRNDVGLIRLYNRITFITNRIEPIPLASVEYVAPNSDAVITGWGSLHASGPVSPVLQEMKLKIISQSECKTVWRRNIEESNICAFSTLNKGVCFGDSGGPLVVDGKQVGIVSFGTACAVGAPNVYTRVYSYKSWIENYAKLVGDHINGAANTFSKTWILILLASATYLHFFA